MTDMISFQNLLFVFLGVLLINFLFGMKDAICFVVNAFINNDYKAAIALIEEYYQQSKNGLND